MWCDRDLQMTLTFQQASVEHEHVVNLCEIRYFIRLTLTLVLQMYELLKMKVLTSSVQKFLAKQKHTDGRPNMTEIIAYPVIEQKICSIFF